MKRLLPLLTFLIIACDRVPKPASGDLRISDTTGPAKRDATDSASWNRYPRVVANTCVGEACETGFPAIACREVRLRTAPSDSAPLGVTVPLNDTVSVTQTDLHLEAPGVVVIRGPHVADHVDFNNERTPVTDTLRLVAGDTLYLIRYNSLGSWDVAVRGKTYTITDGFWFGRHIPDMLGESSRDSSVAVARSTPRTVTWWHVSLGDGRRGFWRFDLDSWAEGMKPDRKYWENDCSGK